MSLSALRGKVVVANFIYTSCALPNFCLRLANNFSVLQKRFAKQLGRDLVLLTVTFDPVHDTPEVLAKYAEPVEGQPAILAFPDRSSGDVERVVPAVRRARILQRRPDGPLAAHGDHRSAGEARRQHRGEPVHRDAARGRDSKRSGVPVASLRLPCPRRLSQSCCWRWARVPRSACPGSREIERAARSGHSRSPHPGGHRRIRVFAGVSGLPPT